MATTARRTKRHAAADEDPALLFFSTRQGRQSNCVLTVEVARFLAERFGRRLVLPSCHTSPLGEQACAVRSDLPPQRQTVVPFALHKVLQARDLTRCWAPASASLPLLSPMDIEVSAVPRNLTCIEVVTHGEGHKHGRNPCTSEIVGDDELRTQLPLRFVRHLTITVSRLVGSGAAPQTSALPSRRLSSAVSRLLDRVHSRTSGYPLDLGAAAAAGESPGSMGRTTLVPSNELRFFDTATKTLVPLPEGDVYAHGVFGMFAKGWLSKRMFGLCALPREADAVVRMERFMQRALGYARDETMCMHWRGEDFHHPTTLQRHKQNATPAATAMQAIRIAKRVDGVQSVLVLSNARYESLHELLSTLRAAGLNAHSPRELADSAFGCSTSYVYGTFAEMLGCSRTRHFVGSPRSSFSSHIVAMRDARTGAANSSSGVSWLL